MGFTLWVDKALEDFRENREKLGQVIALDMQFQYAFMKGDEAFAKQILSMAKEVSADCNDSEVINAVSKMGDKLESGGEASEQQASPQERLAQQKEKRKAKRAQADTVCIFRPPEPEEVTRQIRDVLTSCMSKKKKPADVVEEDTPLIDESGLDSLAAVEVRSELQEYFSIKL